MPIARTLRNILPAGALIAALGTAAASAQDYPNRIVLTVFSPIGSIALTLGAGPV